MIEQWLKHPQTRQACIDAGWFPKRHIDVDHWRANCEQYNYQWSPIVDTFMRAFGGLTVYPQLIEARRYTPIASIFQPEAEEYDRKNMAFYEQHFQISLCPIGGDDYQSGILMDADGGIYSITPLNMLYYGRIVDDALDVLILGIRYPTLYAGSSWFQKHNETGLAAPRLQKPQN
ncbi:SUKH-3 domain-containing protein [Herpetosiphon llansteffanensis]|uniref:SUKH-3 domain-containing protein n=1 Tax=Herpetosiphon llansteffanensis TaxID=2094568 RepID=UPI000D7D0B5C|nr:SUKH-3 domain-containing protein [Herpetosiphon llansteffanensis]